MYDLHHRDVLGGMQDALEAFGVFWQRHSITSYQPQNSSSLNVLKLIELIENKYLLWALAPPHM